MQENSGSVHGQPSSRSRSSYAFDSTGARTGAGFDDDEIVGQDNVRWRASQHFDPPYRRAPSIGGRCSDHGSERSTSAMTSMQTCAASLTSRLFARIPPTIPGGNER